MVEDLEESGGGGARGARSATRQRGGRFWGDHDPQNVQHHDVTSDEMKTLGPRLTMKLQDMEVRSFSRLLYYSQA